MKKENLVVLALTVLASITTGCARNYAGTYTGTEVISLTSSSPTMTPIAGAPVVAGTTPTPAVAPAAPVTAPLTITVNQSMGTLLTGTWNSQGQTGTFQGTASGDTITAVILTMTGTPTSAVNQGYNQYPQVGMTSVSQAQQMGLCNSFMGNISISPNNQITATLNVVQTAQSQAASSQNYLRLTCTGTRVVNATKVN